MLFAKQLIIDRRLRNQQILRSFLYFFLVAILLGLTVFGTSSFVSQMNEDSQNKIVALNDSIQVLNNSLKQFEDSIKNTIAQQATINRLPDILDSIYTEYLKVLDVAKIDTMGKFEEESNSFKDSFLRSFDNVLSEYPSMKDKLNRVFDRNRLKYLDFAKAYEKLSGQKNPVPGNDCQDEEGLRIEAENKLNEYKEIVKEHYNYLQRITGDDNCFTRVSTAQVLLEPLIED